MQIRKHNHPMNRKRRTASHFQAWLLALSMALLTLLSVAFMQVPHARAAGTGPIIHWDQTMIYPGQNNANPWGPVGEFAGVRGEAFTAGQQLKLIVVPGDSLSDATICKVDSNSTTVVPHVTIDPSGTFSANFFWPAVVGKNRTYSICGIVSADNSVVSTRDDGPFTVLAANAPTLTVSAASVAAGGTMTVSGKNWVPPQPLNIDIAACADCDPGNSTIVTTVTSSTGLNSGTFSMTVPIPATAAPANYVVNVFSQNGPLDAFHLPVGVQHLAVTAPLITPTPTTAPTAVPTATTTVGATPTTAARTTSNTNNGSAGGSNGLLVVVVIAIVVLLVAIAGIIFYMLLQRNKQSLPPSGPPSQPLGYPGSGQFNQYGGSNNPMTPFPSGPGQQMNQQGQFGNSPNNQQLWQGNQQGQQAWQGSQTCVRCGSPLTPNSAICGRCGTHNTAMSDPNGPTIAY